MSSLTCPDVFFSKSNQENQSASSTGYFTAAEKPIFKIMPPLSIPNIVHIRSLVGHISCRIYKKISDSQSRIIVCVIESQFRFTEIVLVYQEIAFYCRNLLLNNGQIRHGSIRRMVSNVFHNE